MGEAVSMEKYLEKHATRRAVRRRRGRLSKAYKLTAPAREASAKLREHFRRK